MLTLGWTQSVCRIVLLLRSVPFSRARFSPNTIASVFFCRRGTIFVHDKRALIQCLHFATMWVNMKTIKIEATHACRCIFYQRVSALHNIPFTSPLNYDRDIICIITQWRRRGLRGMGFELFSLDLIHNWRLNLEQLVDRAPTTPITCNIEEH